MAKTTIKIGITPVSNKIMAALAVPGEELAPGEVDITEAAVICAAEHILQKYGGKVTFRRRAPDGCEDTYRIQVKKS